MCAAMCALALGMAACDPASAQRPGAASSVMIRFRAPVAATSVLSGPPASVAAQTARDLFAAAPVVIVANGGSRLAMAAAVRDAGRLHAPLLLASKSGTGTLTLGRAARAAIKRLRSVAVLAVGISPAMVMPRLHGVQVVTAASALPATKEAAPLHKVAVLVRRGSRSAAGLSATATARAAGARVIFVPDADPRSAAKVIAVLAAARPRHVIGIGRAFGPVWRLAARVAVAETGVQLPGGGQVLFPMRRLVALYGHPYSPALGALGQQGLSASITRVKKLAALYRSLSKVPVIPAFEIIASVAQGASQPEGGTYSYLTPADQLRPWVTAATAAGIYVVLDLQAGRASLLAQARQYQGLLERPNVGLAIDPEWKLRPGELPLQQIGSVSSAQVNDVISWLAKLTAAHHLPQKLLVLHQFRLSMITGEQNIDTRHDDLAIVIHMDGQGTPSEKEQTWRAVIGAAPHGIYLGWKNFFVKDHPMLTPKETMDRRPQPVMISYQ
jgi:hypothetical protein